MAKQDFVTVKRFDFDGVAQIYKSLLEAEGIQCELIHDTVQSVLPYLSSGEAPIELIVAASDAERALQILQEHSA